jgi:predicted HAD superfamily hydrolase
VGNIEPMSYADSLIQKWYEEKEINETYWPYQHQIKDWKHIYTVERFCYDNFKSKNWRNRGRTFAFKRKQDYEWFLLRWQ